MVARNLYLYTLFLTTALMQFSITVANPASSSLSLRTFEGQDPRIINGTPALLENTKHQVSIRDRELDDIQFGSGHHCGGSLISENVVLSAAHCFLDSDANDGSFESPKEFIVAMGNLRRFDTNNNTLTFGIEQIITYNERFNYNYNDDIALIFLNGSVPFDHPTVQPIALNAGSLKEGTECQVTGWGVTEEGVLPELLLTIDVPIISMDNCRNKTIYGDSIHEGMLCAGYLIGQHDSCQGDSGGPLVSAGVQVGVVSWGIDCGKPKQPGVYIDVGFYRHWILSRVAENDGDLPTFVDNIYPGGGSMSNFNGSVFLLVFMIVLGAISSIF